MNGNKEIHDELKEIAPFLSGLEKKNNFSVPANYFDEFPAAVRDRIGYQANKQSWANVQRYLLPKYSPWLASMAFLLFVGAFFIWRYQQISLHNTIALKPVSTKEYILDHVDEDMIMDELAEKEGKQQDNSIKSNKNTEDYLLDNIDESTISEEL